MGIGNALDDKDHTANLIAAVSALATVIFGSFSIGFSLYCWQLQRNDLAETKTQNKIDLKEQADHFEKQLDQFEKAHHLEVTPRLQLEIDSWRETPLGMMKTPTVKLMNTGRGTAYDIVVDTYVERFEYLELPIKESEKFQEMYKVLPGEVRVIDVDTKSLAGDRLIEHRTVRPNDAIDGLTIHIPYCGGNHIQGIGGYLDKRLSEEEYLQKMLDVWNEAKDQGSSKVPAELRSDPEAKAYFRLFQDGFKKVASEGRGDIAGIAAETALKARKIIEEKKIRDWTNNRDVENSMINDLDDLMFSVKGRYDLPMTADDIDEILEAIIRVTKRRETQQ